MRPLGCAVQYKPTPRLLQRNVESELPDDSNTIRRHDCVKRENKPIPKQRNLLLPSGDAVLTLRLCPRSIRLLPLQIVWICACKQLLLLRLRFALSSQTYQLRQWCCRESVYLLVNLVRVVDKGCDRYQAVSVILRSTQLWVSEERRFDTFCASCGHIYKYSPPEKKTSVPCPLGR